MQFSNDSPPLKLQTKISTKLHNKLIHLHFFISRQLIKNVNVHLYYDNGIVTVNTFKLLTVVEDLDSYSRSAKYIFKFLCFILNKI